MEQVTIYTTQICPERGKAGAWASRTIFGEKDVTQSAYGETTSPGELDLLAALGSIESLTSDKPLQISLRSQSSYFNKAMSDWVYKWESSGWKTKQGEPVKHVGLWKKLLGFCRIHTIVVDFDQSKETLDVLKVLEKEARQAIKEKKASTRDFNKAAVEHNKQIDTAILAVMNDVAALTIDERREALIKAFMKSLNLKSAAIITGAELEEFIEYKDDGVEIHAPGKGQGPEPI